MKVWSPYAHFDDHLMTTPDWLRPLAKILSGVPPVLGTARAAALALAIKGLTFRQSACHADGPEFRLLRC